MELWKCLVVDDDPVGRELMCTYLEKISIVDTAVDGKDAVDKFRAAADAGAPYQVIFLDILMPEMDGHAAGKAIRLIEKEQGISLHRQVKIVMLSSLKGALDIMQALMDVQSAAYLIKPVEPQKVKETLGQIGFSIPR